MTEAMPLYLIRHCRADGQEPEAPLTLEGIPAAERPADRLADRGIRRIVSSPFLRARQTARPPGVSPSGGPPMPRGGRRPGAGAPLGNVNALRHGGRSPRTRAIAQALHAGVITRADLPDPQDLARLTRRLADPAALRALSAATHQFLQHLGGAPLLPDLEAIAVLLVAAGVPGGVGELAGRLGERLAEIPKHANNQRGGWHKGYSAIMWRGVPSLRGEAMAGTSPLAVYPATSDRWPDLQRLFGQRGAYGGCWCMWWRLSRAEFDENKGEANRRAMEDIIRSGEVPGLLAYAGGEPAGWCSIAPRDAFPRLDRSRTLKRVDGEPVWSIVCFFVARPFRRRGVMAALLRAAVEHAAANGARIVEGYPVDPQKSWPDPYVYTGLVQSFRAAGFVEVARRTESRPVMRYVIGPG